MPEGAPGSGRGLARRVRVVAASTEEVDAEGGLRARPGGTEGVLRDRPEGGPRSEALRRGVVARGGPWRRALRW